MRHAQPPAGQPREHDQEQASPGVPQGLRGEYRCPREDSGNRDAAAHADHGADPGGHAGYLSLPQGGAGHGYEDAIGGVGNTKTWHSATLRAIWSSEQDHSSDFMMDQCG